MVSKHYIKDRVAREKMIAQIGIGKEVATFMVDKGHPNGPELHTITTTGIIIIRNARTKKMVTKLIARPRQIERYFDNKDSEVVKKLVLIARVHQEKGYNKI